MEEKEKITPEEANTCECEEKCSGHQNCDCQGDCQSLEDGECACEGECSCNDDCECSGNHDVNQTDTTCECKKMDKKEKKKEKHKKEKLDDKLNEAYQTIQSLEDKLLREKAEMVNYRRRKEEEVSKMLKYANEDLIVEMLPIIDNFESAIKMDDTNLQDDVSKFLEGFKMIYGNLVSILEKFEVKPIDGVNKPFDPAYHQAVLTEKVEGTESGMVVDVLRKGYILKDKVIRPAMVKVSE